MSKQMLVTMPLVLLLMDWWPLRRLRGDDGGAAIYLPVLWRRIQEKLPLAAVAVVLAVVAIVVQRSGGSVADLETLPLPIRIENALISYVRYPWMAVFPIGLGVFYPHQLVHYPLWMVAGSVVVLAACTWGTFVLRNRHPYLVFGWVWYLVTLSPVAGIIQVGAQSHADRYTYVPLIGLFVAGIWGLSALAEKLRLNPVLSWCGATAMVAALSVATWLQVGYWRDSETLFRRTIEVTRENPIAENNLGLALAEMGRNREAIVHFENSVRIQPKRYQPQYNLGKAYAAEGRTAEAVDHFAAAVRQRSDCAEAHYAWAIMLLKQENYAEAVVHFSESLKGRLAPEFAAGAHLNCGVFQANQGKMDDAIAHFREAVRLQPDSFAGYRNLAMALAAQNRVGEAETCLHAALQRWPGNTDLAAIRDSLRATKR
jgi:Flp pilus assembly protein TadD